METEQSKGKQCVGSKCVFRLNLNIYEYINNMGWQHLEVYTYIMKYLQKSNCDNVLYHIQQKIDKTTKLIS